MSASDAYAVLGVQPDASQAQVRQAYYRAVLRVHPDRTGKHADATGFERVQSAWESLREADVRARYDTLSKPHEATPCQDVDLDDMQAVCDDTGAYRFEHPCRCGDRFTVAESSLLAGTCSLVVPCGCDLPRGASGAGTIRVLSLQCYSRLLSSCSASITVLYSPITPPEGDCARAPPEAAGSSGTAQTR